MISTTRIVITALAAMAMSYSYFATGADLPDEPKPDVGDAKQEAVETKQESGKTPVYRLIVVTPPFFHGFVADTLSGVAADAPAKIRQLRESGKNRYGWAGEG